MQNNSQGRRDRLGPKVEPTHEVPDVRSDRRGLRAECHPVDEAVVPADVMKDFVCGVVTDCLKLNVREAASPDAEVLAVIDALSEVVVDADASTNEFYKVRTTAGVEGFCMKKFITLKLKK